MAVTTPRKRGRPSGTRAKKKEWGLEEYKDAYENMINVRNAAKDEIINLSVELNRKDEQISELIGKATHYNFLEHRVNELEKKIKAKDIRELKLFGVVEYLEDRIKTMFKESNK